MHYYQFNIGDYYAHTHHLDDIENLAYRKMIDYCYLNECCLPDKVEIIAKKIGMRTHSESIASVLEEFFTLGEYGYFQPRIMRDIEKYKEKSEKAKASAAARWSKKPIKSNANALQTQTEGNANHKPITNNHKPVNKDKSTKADRIPYQKIAELYNEVCTNLPKILKPENLNDKRKRAIKKFWNHQKDNQNSEFFAKYFALANNDEFFCGFNNNQDHSTWRADIEFLMRIETYDKFMERQQCLS